MITFVDNGDGTASFTSDSSVSPSPGVTVNPDGSWTLPVMLRFLNPLDIANTGVGTLTVLPAAAGGDVADGIAAFLPLLAQGPPGFTPNFNSVINVIELAPGATPPPGTPVGAWSETDPGNETTPPTYQSTLYIHRGNDGVFTMPNVEALANISGTLADGRTLYYSSSSEEWVISDPIFTQFAACSSLTAAAGTPSTPQQTLGIVHLAAAGRTRNPFPHGSCIVNPASDGSTQIKLYARAGSVSGTIIGEALALPGMTAPYIAHLIPTAAASNPANVIAVGATLDIYITAENVVTSSQNWSTTMTDASFFAYGIPV